MAANVFLGTVDSNWGNSLNWSLLAVPTASDGNVATFNATSPNCTVNTIPRVCNAIDFTGYLNVITMTNSITASGNVTFDTSMSSRVSGSGELIISANCTFTGNGGTWNNNITFAGVGATCTLTSDLNVVGTIIIAQTTIINGAFNVNTGGFNSALGVSGTATIVFNGTGTWTGNNAISNVIQINTSGTLTLTGTVKIANTSLTYIAGTVVTTGSDFSFATNVTLNVSGSTSSSATTTSSTGVNFNTLTITSNASFTLSSPIRVIGTFTARGTWNGSTIYCSSSISVTNTSSGTSNIILDGTGTWSGAGTIQNNLNINTSGTITISGNIYYNTGTLTYISGTIITTGSTLNISLNTTLNTSGMSWNNVTPTASGVIITLLSNLNIGGNYTISNPNTVNGFTMYVSGNLLVGSTFAGTTICVLNGTGTWSGGGTNSKQMMINTTGTITVSGTINVTSATGKITYVAGTVVTTGSTLTITDDYTIDTNGIIWDNLSLSQNATRTLTNNSVLRCVNLIAGTVNGQIVNGSNVEVSGNMTVTGFILFGTSTIILTGTGTLSGTGTIRNNLTINTSGTITVSGTVNYNTGTLTYVSGTVITTGSTLTIALSTTLNTSGITWNNVSQTGPNTITLLSDWDINGLYLTVNTITVNGFNLYLGGSAQFNTNTAHSGTTVIIFDGSGTWGNASGGWIANNTIINTNGILRIHTTCSYGTGTLTYLKGVVKTENSNFTFRSGTLLNMHRINFNQVTVIAGATLTMNEFFCGRPELKTKVISTTTSNYNITFTNTVPKKAFHVNVKNCTVTGRNQLNIINRDGNSGSNSNIIFGEIGRNGFPINMFTTEMSYPTGNGFNNNMIL